MNRPCRRATLIVLLAGTPLAVVGCASSSEESLFGHAQPAKLAPSDFTGAVPQTEPAAVAEHAETPKTTPPGATQSASAATTATLGKSEPKSPPSQPTASPDRVLTQIGAPPEPATPASPNGEPVTIDSVIGQINGRPVIASEIFESLDGVLRADAAAAKTAGEWRQAAANRIVRELRRRVVDELVLSEARRALTPEQQQGLLKFLETIQSRLVSQQQGSSVAADELYREQTGRGLREEAEDIRNQELIRFEIKQRVEPRVQVAWRDVKNEYERSFDTWNPPAEYTFRLIYVPAANATAIASITDALQAGKPFVEVAGLDANEFLRRDGGKLVRKFAGPQSTGEFSPTPELNAAMRGLAAGQTIGPISYAPDPEKPDQNRRMAWLHLEKVNTPPSTSLYDAQLDINAELTTKRRSIEESRYLERLFKRGNVSSMEMMGEKLLQIATDRYAPRFKQNR